MERIEGVWADVSKQYVTQGKEAEEMKPMMKKNEMMMAEKKKAKKKAKKKKRI